MAYDEKLADRVRTAFANHPAVTEKKMFGGLSFLVNGHMCCGIVGDKLCVRVEPDHHDEALAETHVTPMDFTGKPMRGMVYVLPEGLGTPSEIKTWVNRGLTFVEGLPAK